MSCYVRDGQVYCKDDYFRLFARRSCSRCQNGIYASELVMRVRDLVFHLHCFTCAWCNAALTQGDVFGLRGNLVYCRHHYDMVAAEEATEPDRFAGYGPFPVEMPPGRKGRPRKKKAVEERHAGMSPLDPGLHLTHLDGPQSSPPLSSGGGRTKRMRTSFKHHQLRTMKSYFALNQNPDAKDLKQLAQKTGLSKRVLQVWFQNARAKWRRNNIKQELMPGLTTGSSDGHSPQLHHHSHQGAGLCSPGSSYSEEPSPVGGVASDCSTQVGGPSMEFDSSNPLTPLVGHHGMGGHMTTFPEIY